jgi:hypothetical protein
MGVDNKGWRNNRKIITISTFGALWRRQEFDGPRL